MRRLLALSVVTVALLVGASFAHAQSSPYVCAGGFGHHFGGRICF